MICSVVPALNNRMRLLIKETLKIKVFIIGKNILVPMKNNYKNPHHVGQDRLVNAYAAKVLYGKPVIVIDLGTAITFDVVSSKGDYEGGIIIPGIKLSLDSLASKTALLPHVQAVRIPRSLIGKTTQESILSGIFNGYGSLLEGLIQKIKNSKKSLKEANVILTGGYSSLIINYIKSSIDYVDNDLLFKGIDILIKEN